MKTSSRGSIQTGAVVLCLLACLAATVWGFVGTGVIDRGLLKVWDRASVVRFLVFLGLAAAMLAAALWTRAPRAAWAALVAVWLGFAFGVVAVASTAAVFAAALAAGSAASAPAALRERLGPAAGALISLTTGLAIVLAVVQLLVHFPINTPLLYALLAGAAVFVGRSWLIADARALQRCLAAPVEGRAGLVGLAVLMCVLAVHTVHAALPERMYDAALMHLAVPTSVASHREWAFDVSLYSWAVMPMGADWLYTAGYLLGGEAAARLLNFGVHATVVALLYVELRERLPRPAAALLAAVYSATPLAVLESASLFVENALSLFLFAAAVFLARAWRSHRWQDGPLLGLLLGAALATKLLAVFAALAVIPLGAYSLARSLDRRQLAAAVAGASAVVLATGAVPYLYAWHAAGNPVLPYLNHIFKSPYFSAYDLRDTRWMGNLRLGYLFDATFRSWRFGELRSGCFGFQHLLFLPAGALAAAFCGRRAARIVLAVGLAYCAGVLYQTQYVRYLYPAFPLLALAEAEAVRLAVARPLAGAAVTALAACALVANLAFMPTSGWTVEGFHTEAIFSTAAREDLVARTIPQRPLLRLATERDGKRVRMLQIGDPVGMDLQGVAVYTTWHGPEASGRLLRVRGEQDFARLVRHYRLTHVLHDQRMKVHPGALSFLARHATLQGELNYLKLYRLVDPPGTP